MKDKMLVGSNANKITDYFVNSLLKLFGIRSFHAVISQYRLVWSRCMTVADCRLHLGLSRAQISLKITQVELSSTPVSLNSVQATLSTGRCR